MKPEWNIKFTLVEPGGFTTEGGKSSYKAGAKQTFDSTYDRLKPEDIARAFNEIHSINGDVSKAAMRMYELGKMEDPPLRVLLGSDAVGAMKAKLETYASEVRWWDLFIIYPMADCDRSRCRFRNGRRSLNPLINHSGTVYDNYESCCGCIP